MYRNVQLFISNKTGILNATVFKYSLHKRNDTTPKISINFSMTFNYYTQFPQNWQSSLTMNISRSTAIQPVCCVP